MDAHPSLPGGDGGGGGGGPDIVVNGDPSGLGTTNYGTGFSPGDISSVGNYNGSDSTDELIGQAGAVPNANYPPGWDHARDRKIDTAGDDLAQRLMKAPNQDRQEYIGFIKSDGHGGFVATNVLPGGNTSASAGQYQPADFGLKSWGDAVAMGHNHPDYALNPTTNTYDFNPLAANGASNADSTSLQTFAAQQGVDPQFRSYVVHDGYVGEYDYVQNMHTVVGLPNEADTKAVIGEYNPDFSGH